MNTTEKLIATLAKDYAATHVGVTKSFVEKSLRGERDSATAETAKRIYRLKEAQIKRAVDAPVNPNSALPP